jgi:hypothetical protein
VVILQVFDPPMCCPTGVCGPKVDPALTQFAADINWLKSQGVHVERFNLAQEPDAFAKNRVVKKTLAQAGADCLPLILVDSRVVSQGTYPSREELATFTGITAKQAPSLTQTSLFEQVTVRRGRSFPRVRGGECCGGSGCCE